MLNIAQELADTPEAIEAAGCLSAKQVRIHGKALSRVVQAAMAMDEKDLPIYPRRRRPSVSPKVPERIKAIKEWRDKLAEKLELDSALLFNKALMAAIAVQHPKEVEALRTIEGIRNWQVDAFGRHVIGILSKIP